MVLRETRDSKDLPQFPSRTDTGPCDFAVQREISGTVKVTPSVDAAGNLNFTIERVSLHGSLSNPANGKAVTLHWIDQNGEVGLAVEGTSAVVAVPVRGHFVRRYDETGGLSLSMDLPADGVAALAFAPGQSSPDAWTHVCGLLA
jgi:hypothetical protein